MTSQKIGVDNCNTSKEETSHLFFLFSNKSCKVQRNCKYRARLGVCREEVRTVLALHVGEVRLGVVAT